MTLRKTTAIATIMGLALIVSACADGNGERKNVQYKAPNEKLERSGSILK